MSWEKKKIRELCQIEKGKIGIQKATPGEFPLVVTAEERLSHNEYHFEGNAVVIPLVSSTGHGHRSLKRIHFQSGKFAVGNILCAVIPNDENVLRADYLYRFLDLNREKELVSRMRGMANVTLPMKEIAKIEIPVPPIEAKINFVKQYTKLEEKSNDLSLELSHQLDLVKQLRQAFLREAMQGKLVPQDENDEPASVLLEKIKAEKERLIKEKKIKKQKPLPPITVGEIPFEIPKNWMWCRLGEISEIKRGKGPKYTDSGVFKMLNQKCVRWFTVETEHCKSIDKKWFEDLSDDFKVVEEDLLVNSTGDGTIGRSGLAGEDCNGFVFDSHILRVRANLGIKQNLICSIINSDYGQGLIESIKGATSTKQTELGVNNLSNFPIPLPPLSEQKRIVAKLDELMQYCDALEASIKESQQQNELLLQQVLREALEPKVKEVEKV